MPTTTEVEARLRRTAESCEPIVDDLADRQPRPTGRAARAGRVGWLVAAALVAAVAVAGMVAVTGDDGPSDEVRAHTPDTLFDLSTTTAPVAGHPTLDTALTLPDGTEVVLSIPGPERWTPRSAEVDLDLEGVDDPVEVGLSPIDTALSEPVVDERISDRAFVATWGDRRALFVEVDGWVATLHLASDGGALPDELVPALARDLTFVVGAGGPVEVAAPGATVPEVRTNLVREADPFGREATLTVAHVRGGAHPTCVGDPPVPVLSRTHRCVADDRLLLSARGVTTQAVLPGIDGRLGTVEAAAGQRIPVPFPDGTQSVIALPAGDPWPVAYALADVAIDGVSEAGGHRVRFFPESAVETAARTSSTMEEAGDLRWLARAPDGSRRLLVQAAGWTAELELDDPGTVPDGVMETLIRTIGLEATAAGPGALTANGLTVTYADVRLGQAGEADRPETQDVLGLSVDGEACEGPPGRCLDGDVRAIAFGSRAQQVIDDITAETVRPPS